MEYTVKVKFINAPIRFVEFREYGHGGSHAYYEHVSKLIGEIGYLNGSDEPYDYVIMGNPYSFLTEYGKVWADKEKDEFEIISFEEGNKIPKEIIAACAPPENKSLGLARNLDKKVLIVGDEENASVVRGKVGTITGVDRVERDSGHIRVWYTVRVTEYRGIFYEGDLLYAPEGLLEGQGMTPFPCNLCGFDPYSFYGDKEEFFPCDYCEEGKKEWDEKFEKLKEGCESIWHPQN